MGLEGRLKTGSQFVFSSPSFHKDFDSELEFRLGVLGGLIEKGEWVLDYELSADAKQADGPSVQAGLRKKTDVDFLFETCFKIQPQKSRVTDCFM